MNVLVFLANGLTGIVSAGGKNLVGLITGVLPNVLILLTMINAIVALIGEEKVNEAAKKLTRFRILRYTVIPVVALFFFTNPMCYTMGRFVEEDLKVPTIDAIFTMAHPITGLFPHGNPGELFVWMGIATGVEQLGISTTPLAIRYLIVGIICCLIRGCVTEVINNIMIGKKTAKAK